MSEITKEEFESRMDKAFWLFTGMIPTGNSELSKQLEEAFGSDMEELVPQIMNALNELCKNYPETTLGYFDLIKNLISFVMGETDELPEVDYDPEELREMMTAQKVGEIIRAKKEKKKQRKLIEKGK